MGGMTYDIEKELYKLAKGSVAVGGLNILWDLTDGLTEEEWIRQRKVEYVTHDSYWITKTGRVIMPQLGIY